MAKTKRKTKNLREKVGQVFDEVIEGKQIKYHGLTIKQIEFIEAYIKNNCQHTTTCKKLGISKRKFEQWKTSNPQFRQALMDAKELLIDFAERQLLEKIKGGNLGAIIFFLKCQAKHRGYLEWGQLDIMNQIKAVEGLAIKIANIVRKYVNEPKLQQEVLKEVNLAINDYMEGVWGNEKKEAGS